MSEKAASADNALKKILVEVNKSLPEGYRIRQLERSDFDRQYIELLSQLTSVGDISRKMFEDRMTEMENANGPHLYHNIVIVELAPSPDGNMVEKKVVASACLVRELHFIHGCGARGRIEDVIVDQSLRGKKFGYFLNDALVKLAKEMCVYKISLECFDHLVPFYSKFGFNTDKNNYLVQRF